MESSKQTADTCGNENKQLTKQGKSDTFKLENERI